MLKRALAINTVILLALALIAIVIIGILIAKSSGTYIKSTSCENTGGKCVKAIECEGKKSFLPGCKENEICCIEEEAIK